MPCCARWFVARPSQHSFRCWSSSLADAYAKRSRPRFDSLGEAVRELEGDETEYAGLIIHSASHDARSMEVVEFLTRSEDLRTIILPEPDGTLHEQAKRVAKLPQVRVPRVWSRSELRRALSN